MAVNMANPTIHVGNLNDKMKKEGAFILKHCSIIAEMIPHCPPPVPDLKKMLYELKYLLAGVCH